MISDFNIDPEQIPMPDDAILRLIALCTSEETEVKELSQLISANAVISSRLLSMANSSYYSFSETIESISHAIVAMGIDVVKNITLCFAVKETLANASVEGIDTNEFWRQAIYRAVACQFWMAQVSDESLSENLKSEAFTCGLLADIGFLVLFMLQPAKRDRWAVMSVNTPKQRLEMELQLFDCNHCQMGDALLTRWQLPKVYAHAIAHHHDESISDPLIKSLYLADWSVALIESCNKASALQTLLASQNVLDESHLSEFFQQLTEQAEAVSGAFGSSDMSAVDMNAVFLQANQKLAEDNLGYQELTWKLQDALAERDRLAEKLDLELEIAREIQQSLQSDISYREHVAAINIPAKKLSGDFFDYYEHDQGLITFCLGDVSGKGTHAALVMAKTISLYRCLSKVEQDLKTIVNLINDEIYETSIRGMFVTFIAGRLDLNNKQLEIINAGHIPALQIGSRTIHQVEPHGPPLGVVEKADYCPDTLNFDDHRLYLYTDGITEAKKHDGSELGTKEFVQWIIQSKKLSLKEQLSWLQQRFESDIETWEDDLTLMMLSSR